MWRAGETAVFPVPGSPLVTSLECFYRDSFFMLLREDSCCHGACAAAAAKADDLRAVADTLDRNGSGGSDMRDRIVRERQTHEALARKRPKNDEPIDLTGDDDS